MDERALALFRIQRPFPEEGHVTRYQTFLLALSDQILITGIALLTTTFAQIESLSAFSLHVVVPLAACASSVHLDTLLVLRSHFVHHKKQTAARVMFMLLFLLLVLGAMFLWTLTWFHSGNSTASCEIIRRSGDPFDMVVYEWLASALLLIALYYWAICALREWNDSSAQIMSPSTVALLRLAFGRADLETYLREKRPPMVKQSREDHLLTSKASKDSRHTRSVIKIVMPLLALDVLSSLIFNVTLDGFWLGWQLKLIFQYLLERADVDTQPLFEVSFGQMMPMLMLAAFIMNALEVGGETNTFDSPARHDTPLTTDRNQIRQRRSGGRVCHECMCASTRAA